jgi:Spy/CpxP family protein refolding chaperone
MKILVSALVALSVLSAVAAPASAAEFDSKKFWQEQGNRY